MTFQINNVSKSFGKLQVLQNVSMRIEKHKIICIVGPSGAGKTTILNLISGVIQPDAGSLEGFSDKTVSYIFQETRLLPWKTVEQNIDFVLKDKLDKKKRAEVLEKSIAMVDLSDFRNYYPAQLSGGMKQRVAIARAFAFPAEILLMDEPFDGLDPQLKKNVMDAFLNLWEMEKRSVFFVTHDMNEALLLGDEIYVLSSQPASIKGRILNPIPHRDRDPASEEMRRIERQLHELITKPL